jgi:integrase
MVSWEEGRKLADLTTSIQLKAIILTQLDAGFRPSEFIDLNYGDVSVKRDLVVFNVRNGKTGGRSVICQRCVPYFLRWYHSHATKKKNDPLWIMEFVQKRNSKEDDKEEYKIRRYTYQAIVKRVYDLGKKVKIEKPLDFYNLRHSSCVLDKIDNLPIELAADRHGHSVGFFTQTYGRLSIDDVANRFRRHYGGEEEEQKLQTNTLCERCDFPNEPGRKFCGRCGSPLNFMTAIERDKIAKVEEEMIKKKAPLTEQKVMEVIMQMKDKGLI